MNDFYICASMSIKMKCHMFLFIDNTDDREKRENGLAW